MKTWILIIGLLASSLSLAVERPLEVLVSEGQVATVGRDYHSYNFGRVWVNTSSTIYFNVRNTGNTVLNFQSAYVSGIDFQAYHSCSGQLPPGSTCSFQIRYWPAFEGYDFGRFDLDFGENAGVTVNLNGEAIRRY